MVAGSAANSVLSTYAIWKQKQDQPDPSVREARVMKVEDRLIQIEKDLKAQSDAVTDLRQHMDTETNATRAQMQHFHDAREISTRDLRLEIKGDMQSLAGRVDQNQINVMAKIDTNHDKIMTVLLGK